MEKYLIFKLGVGTGLFLAALFVFLYNRNPQKKSKRRKWRYKWNSVLDKNTCESCSTLHEKIFTKEELRNTHPPLHGLDENNHRCRCYLTLAK